MTDTVPSATRSRMMAAVRSKDTKPEMAVRHALHAMGFRYSLHSTRLPGKPDLVLPKYGAVIFVEGCFWHGHEDCRRFRLPATRTGFWEAKIARNRERDERTRAALEAMGLRHYTIWECSLTGPGSLGTETVASAAAEWLKSGHPSSGIRGSSTK